MAHAGARTDDGAVGAERKIASLPTVVTIFPRPLLITKHAQCACAQVHFTADPRLGMSYFEDELRVCDGACWRWIRCDNAFSFAIFDVSEVSV